MAQSDAGSESPRRIGLLKDQVQLVKKKDSDRYEIVPIQERLSFEKGFFIVIHACQLLAQKNDGIVLVGLAGPSGAGKTIFTEKILHFMPSVAVISMDNYNDASRIVDDNFDDPRLTDYDTLLRNISDLKAGKEVQVPIYDFKTSSRAGFRTLEAPSSRIVIVEGIYALSEKLRPLLDLRVSVTGGVHFDLVKRVLRDTHRAGNQPEEIIQQISETVYPMYKAFIEPDLQTAHIKIVNKFNPFSGFQNPTYILKSARRVEMDQIRAILTGEYTKVEEQTYDIYLLPPGEDPESCQSYLRMRNRDGKYSLMFEECVTDHPFIISPRITFEVSVRLLGGLMALGYTIAAILKRNSHIFSDDRVTVKIDWLEQLNRSYTQVQGKDRLVVRHVAEQLGLEGSYTPRTYIEQIQLEKLVKEVTPLPEDLKTKLSLEEDIIYSPKEALSRASGDRVAWRSKNLKSHLNESTYNSMSHSYSNHRIKNHLKITTDFGKSEQRFDGISGESTAPEANEGAVSQLSDQIATLNDRIDEFTSRIEELSSRLTVVKLSPSQLNMSEACSGSAPTSYFISNLSNGLLTGSSSLPKSSSSSQLTKDSPLLEEILTITRGQRQILHRLDNLSNLLKENLDAKPHGARTTRRKSVTTHVESVKHPLVLALALSGIGFCLYKGFWTRT